MIYNIFKIFISFLIIIFIGGCTHALPTEYKDGIVLNNSNNLNGIKIAVYEFKDIRAIVDINNKDSYSFVSNQGMHHFGLKYKGLSLSKISFIVQDILIRELKKLGADAFKGEKTSTQAHIIKGEIINFEFDNEVGFSDVIATRHISINLSMNNSNGEELFSNRLINKLERVNEGMISHHEHNLHRLMNKVLKDVNEEIINLINGSLISKEL
jgi:hypothetical protein